MYVFVTVTSDLLNKVSLVGAFKSLELIFWKNRLDNIKTERQNRATD